MCTGKCAKCIGGALYPFAVICIVANILLYFPGWSADPAANAGEQLTTEVTTFLGIAGGGLLVLIPAIQIQASGRKGCCGNRCGMLLSILCAAIGLTGSLFCLVMSTVGLTRGPVCAYYPTDDTNVTAFGNTSLVWGRPLENPLPDYNNESYLFHKESWNICVEPQDVVLFNIILFSCMLGASSFEAILCAVQFFNGIFGFICGTCRETDVDYEDMKKEAKC